jgi:hypothetical protein
MYDVDSTEPLIRNWGLWACFFCFRKSTIDHWLSSTFIHILAYHGINIYISIFYDVDSISIHIGESRVKVVTSAFPATNQPIGALFVCSP